MEIVKMDGIVEQTNPSYIVLLPVLFLIILVVLFIIVLMNLLYKKHRENAEELFVDYSESVEQTTQDLSEVVQQMQELSVHTLVDISFSDSDEVIP